MLRTIFCGAVAASFFVTAGFSATPQDRQLCVKGKDSDQVIAACTRVIDDRKESRRNRVDAYNSRGIAHDKKNNLELALADYNEALRLEPGNVNVIINRAIIFRKRADHDRAIQEFDRAQKKGLSNIGKSIVYENRGRSLFAKRNYQRALADFNAAIKIDPKESFLYELRGEVYFELRDYTRAISDYSQGIRLSPNDAYLYNLRCWTRAVAGIELQSALNDCNESLRLEPNVAGTLDSRGMVYLKLGRADEAIADYDAAAKLNPKHASYLYGRGIGRLRKGDTVQGQADIAAAIALQSDIAKVYAGWGVEPPAGAAPAATKAAPVPLAGDQCAGAETHWKSAEAINSVAVYEDHLKRFAACPFAALAKARIEMLTKKN